MASNCRGSGNEGGMGKATEGSRVWGRNSVQVSVGGGATTAATESKQLTERQARGADRAALDAD